MWKWPTPPSTSGRRRPPRAISSSTRSSRRAARAAPRRCIPDTASCPSARRFPVALAKAGIVFIGPNPKAIAAMGDKIESKKAAAAAKVSTVPGHLGVIEDDAAGGQDRRRDRLSRDDQGLGRRRRQGHADRPFERRGRGRLRAGALGGEVLVRRRPRLHREVHRRSPPHRNPGARRQARQRHLSRRAGMLDPAPQPEGDRGIAEPAPRSPRPASGWDCRRSRSPRRSATIPPAPWSSSPGRTRASISSK